jgi:hypothetical protein
MRKRVITIRIAVAVCLAILILVLRVIADTPQTNPRYVMWKWGWAGYSQDVFVKYFIVDSTFRKSLHDTDKREIRKWFPDLRRETKPEKYLDRNQPFFISSPDFLWIGATQWAIEFQDGKVTGFALIKDGVQLEDRLAFSESESLEGLPS